MYPILVTVPFGDADQEGKSEERQAYEDKLIDEILKDEVAQELSFYHTWSFYPYKNPNPRGQPLTPKQLYNVLADELDLFLPKMNTKEDVKRIFDQDVRKQKYRHPHVPAHVDKTTGKEVVGEDEEVPWYRGRYAMVADDVDCQWVRLVHVSEYECKKRLLRVFRRQGQDISGLYDEDCEDQYMSDANASDVDIDLFKCTCQRCEEITRQDPPEPDPRFIMDENGIASRYFEDENGTASRWLGVVSPHECYMYGIQGSYMKTDSISTAVINLEQGNMDFVEFVPQYLGEKEADEEAIRLKMVKLAA